MIYLDIQKAKENLINMKVCFNEFFFASVYQELFVVALFSSPRVADCTEVLFSSPRVADCTEVLFSSLRVAEQTVLKYCFVVHV